MLLLLRSTITTIPNINTITVAIQECTSKGIMTTGHSVETWECLTERAYALSSYALTYVALK